MNVFSRRDSGALRGELLPVEKVGFEEIETFPSKAVFFEFVNKDLMMY
jgi:hypothetical protein